MHNMALQETSAAEAAATSARKHLHALQQHFDEQSAQLEAEAAALDAEILEASAPVAAERQEAAEVVAALEAEVADLRYVL